MRTLNYYLIFVLFVIISCNRNESILTASNDNIVSVFKLTDSIDIPKKSFRTGEIIRLSFSLTNLSNEVLLYSFTGVPIIFEIQKNDSILSTSVDSLYFPHVVWEGQIKNRETFRDTWRIPTAFMDPLPAGRYTAFVKHNSFFKNFRFEETQPIDFIIIE